MATKSGEKSGGKNVTEKSDAEPLFPMGLTPFNDLDRIFDEYFNRGWMRGLRPAFSHGEDLWGTYEMRQPTMDVIDRDKEILIRAELPGVDKKDLEISISDDVLTIKGTSQQERKEEKEDFHRKEIRSGSFCRRLSLPNNVDTGKATADFKNGLLELTIPKTSSTTNKKTIKVS